MRSAHGFPEWLALRSLLRAQPGGGCPCVSVCPRSDFTRVAAVPRPGQPDLQLTFTPAGPRSSSPLNVCQPGKNGRGPVGQQPALPATQSPGSPHCLPGNENALDLTSTAGGGCRAEGVALPTDHAAENWFVSLSLLGDCQAAIARASPCFREKQRGVSRPAGLSQTTPLGRRFRPSASPQAILVARLAARGVSESRPAGARHRCSRQCAASLGWRPSQWLR